MRGWLFLFIAVLPSALSAAPAAFERGGDIHYEASDGAVRTITRGGGFAEPALSPDGRTIAFIHRDSEPDANGNGGRTSLWVADGVTGTTRRLLAPKYDDDPKLDLEWIQQPVFSLDGGFVYVEARAWATSEAIHQVSVATGRERFVVAGWLYGVLRNGRYRGYLVVGQHKYLGPPDYGSHNPVFVFRPDGRQILRVPGSEKDDGAESLPRWLKAKGWTLTSESAARR